jgi:hypothetical protein
MRTYVLLPLLFLLLACGHHKGGKGSSGTSSDGEETTDLNGSFYKRYTGTVAGKAVVVHLMKYGNTLQGMYCYTNTGRDIELHDWNDTTRNDGVFFLNETAQEDMPGQNGEGPSWALSIEENTATGTWRSADGKQEYPIELTEDYPEGSVRLDAFWVADSAALRPDKPKSSVAKISYGYLLPKGGKGSFLYDVLRQQVFPKAAASDEPEAVAKSAMAAYFNDYREENRDAKIEMDSALQSFSFNYTNDEAVYVHYNQDDWLVTELFDAYYTGGAHGNYGSSYANIDLEQKRVWKLTDIVADTAALRPALNDAVIAYFNLKPGQGVAQRLLTDDVPPTENMYIGSKGLSFVYNPYEIASYADGQVTLFIPYRKIFSLLTPAFKQRMKLSEQSGVAMLSILGYKH